MPKRELADGHSSGSIEVRVVAILHDPPGRGEHLVDRLSS